MLPRSNELRFPGGTIEQCLLDIGRARFGGGRTLTDLAHLLATEDGLQDGGFGGGAMIGSPLAAELMKIFATDTDVGVTQTFIVMAGLYFVFMMGGALSYRVPATGWTPRGWTPPVAQGANAMITHGHVHVSKVWGIPQFWLVWMVLCMNVSAGDRKSVV